jgi:ribosomal protein L32
MRYKNDPKWIKAKYYSKCSKCGKEILKQSACFWYPLDKSVYCEECGKVASAQFEAEAFDEEMLRNPEPNDYGSPDF